MEIAATVLPNQENDEEDLTRCNPSFLPLPAVRLGNGIWLARWKLSDAERLIISQTGDIYIRMHAVDGDELIMPHRLFVERPNIQALREHYSKGKEPKSESESPLIEPTF